ncbi:MAG TPA: DUF2193 domain-containing protein [Methanoregulaceae archaeon]|nr:DUF2193 domain-containing protein [Methanomicrobiales archaeon]HNW80102.1 DUF2193 domain-containing protein [Methanoregulaceae archaeon]HPS23283.1 DUF2193 domain-containing protein [Methanoregulaceae archaeon]
MTKLCQKMIDEAMAAQRADVETVKKKRGGSFVVSDAKSYLSAVKKMKPAGAQSKAVFDLHTDSVKAHFGVLEHLTSTVRPEDDPYVEHYQTPVIMEILYDEDPSFRKSVTAFSKAIRRAEALVGKEAARRYAGFYGPTCVVDFALIPGSTSNVVNQILKTVDIPTPHKQAILASKSWGMNTSYGFGDVFAHEVEKGATLADAVKAEIGMMEKVYDRPVDAQADLMDSVGMTSFDARKYMEGYRKKMEGTVRAAMDDDVHYANIVTIPAYCVGDIAHHIAQSTFNMCKDDVIMATIEAVTDVMDATLNAAVPSFKTEEDVLTVATGASASAAEYILELDGFNAIMLVDLLTKRWHNYVQLYPKRGAAAELHNCDFMDMIYRGWKYVDQARRRQNGTDGLLKPKVSGVAVDLQPVHENEVLMNPQRYAYPACAITVRASAMLRLSDYPCLLTSEPVTATLMTNIIALHKDVPAAPARICKNCASAALIDFRHQYCQWKCAV